MLSGFFAWFKALTTVGKVGTIAAAITATGVGINAVNQNQPSDVVSPQTSCVASSSQEFETQPISFTSSEINDSSLPKGSKAIKTVGINGEKKLTYSVTKFSPTNCKAATKVLEKEEIVKAPVNAVTSIGTYVAPVAKPAPEPIMPAETNCPITTCNDGTCSQSTGRGTCSHHDGVRSYN